MSDTHDNIPLMERAVRSFNEAEVELVLHAGDYVAGFVVPKLKELNSRLIGVFGNNDGDRELLKRRFGEFPNLELRGSFAEIDAEGSKIALLHGSDRDLLEALADSRNLDFIVYGHTHITESSKNGKTLIINPGEVCGYLTGRSSIAVLDTVKSSVQFIDL